jgi:DNA-binding MarR family transcriptional regulator
MTESIQFSQTVRNWMDVFMQRSMSGWRQYVRASGLSMPQFSILMRLNYRGGCGISNISEHMDISTAAASQLVDKQVTLSPKGRQFIAQGIEERYRWVDEMAPKLSLEEQAQIADALNVMIRAAEELETDPV